MGQHGPHTNQVALITGASSGIGKASALLFGERGFRVAVNYHRNRSAALEVVAAIEARGGTALAVQADVSDHGSATAMATQVLNRWGRIDVLVNSAGAIPLRRPLAEYPPDAWRQTLALNLDGVYNCCHAVLPSMIARGHGRIVNLSSIHSRTGGGGGTVPYAAAKAAVNALTKGLAVEVAPMGILVNAVAPGPTDTPFQDADRARFEQRVKQIPVGRAARAEEVAEVIWFAANTATYMAGETIFYAGGLL